MFFHTVAETVSKCCSADELNLLPRVKAFVMITAAWGACPHAKVGSILC